MADGPFNEQIPALLQAIDAAGCIIAVSDRWLTWLGYNRADVVGQPWHRFLTPQSQAELAEPITGLQEAAEETMSVQFCHRDGTVRHVSLSTHWADSEGESLPYCIAALTDVTQCLYTQRELRHYREQLEATGRDRAAERQQVNAQLRQEITRRQQAETTLAQQERIYRASFDAAPVGVAHTDLACRFARVNQRFCDLLGFTPAELIKLQVADITHPDDHPIGQSQFAQLLSGEHNTFTIEKRYRRKDGGTLWAKTTIALVRDEAQNPLFAVAIVEDIGDRKQAERALESSQKLLQLVFDHLPQRIFWKGLDGRFLGCNQAFANDMGQAHPQDLIGKRDRDLPILPPDLRQAFEARDRAVIESDAPIEFAEQAQTLQDGRIRWVSTVKAPLKTSQGELLGIFGGYEDITDRVLARESLQRYGRMIEAAQDGICLLDREYRYQIINRTYRDWYGYGDRPILGHTVAEVLGESVFRDRLKPLLDRCLQGETLRYAHWFTFPHFGRRFRSVTLTPYREETGAISGIVTSISDLTALKESELRQQQLLEIIESTPNFVGMAQPDGQVFYLNPALSQFIQGAAGAVDYSHFRNYHPRWAWAKLIGEGIPTAIAHGTWQGETALKSTTGHEIPLSQTIMAHRDEQGEVKLLSTIARDISDQKALEQQLRDRLAFEQLLSRISTNFVDLPSHALRQGITQALQEIAIATHAQRSYVYLLSSDQQFGHLHSQWHGPDLEPIPEAWQQVPAAPFQWWMAQLNDRQVIAVADTCEMPAEAVSERLACESMGTRSLAVVPMYYSQTLIGYIGFAVTHPKPWSENELALLKLVGNLFANAYQRQQSQLALQRQEHYFRSLTEHASDLVALLDHHGRLQYITPSVTRLLGYAPNEMANRPVSDYIAPADGPLMTRIGRQAIVSPGVAQPPVQLRVRHQAGQWRYFEAITTSLLDDPAVQGVVVNCRDVSDRVVAETAQRRSEQVFRAIFEQTAVSMAQIALDGTFIKVNPAFCQLVGYTAAELIGEPADKVTHADDVASVLEQHEAVAQGAVPAQLIYQRLICAHGSTRHVQVVVTAVLDEHDTPAYLAAVYNDVTEQVVAEQSLRSLVEGTASVTGEAFFPVLAQHLADSLEVDHILINQLNPDRTLTTLVFWSHRKAAAAFSYSTPNTPCDRTLREGFYCCPTGLQTTFPEDDDLKQLNAESYIGVALTSQDGTVLGNICALHSQPIGHLDNAVALLRIFASRASAELERQRSNRALQANEAKWRSILDNMPVLLDAIDDDGLVTLWNRECERVTGYSADEIIGNPHAFRWLYPGAQQRRTLAETWGDRTSNFRDREWTLTCKDGTQRVIAWSSLSGLYPISDLGAWGVGVDVTERRQAEDALRQSEDRFQRLAANMPGVIYRYHQYPDGRDRFSYVSPGSQALWELSPADIYSDSARLWNLIHPDDLDAFVQSIQAALAANQPWFHEHRIVTPSGQLKWVQGAARAEAQPDGSLTWDGVLLDVTDRKQAETKLIASEARFQRLASNTPGIIYRYHLEADGSDRFSYVSAACRELWEIEPEAAIEDAEQVWRLVHPADLDALKTAFLVSRRDLTPLAQDYRLTTPAGHHKWLKVVARPVSDATGGCFWDGLIIDVTAQTQTQEALRASEALNRAILEALPDLLIRMRRDGLCLDMQYPSHFKVVCPKERHIGRLVQDTLSPPVAADRMQAVERALATGKVQIYEYELAVHDELRWEEARVVPMSGNEVLVLVRDIDDRKRAEAALRESEALNRAIINALPDMMVRMTRDGLCLAAQHPEPFPALVPNAAVVNHNIREFLPPELAEQRLAIAERAIATQQTQYCEYQLPINGELRWEESRIVPLTDTEVLVLVRDIHERHQAEEEVRRLNQVLETQNQQLEELVELRTAELVTFMNTLPDQIFVVDRAQNVMTFGNQVVVEFAQKPSRQAFEGKSVYECFAAEQAAHYEVQNQQVFESGEVLHVEEAIETADGRVYLDTYKIPLKRPDGRVYGLIGTSRDITELVEARQALEAQAAQLEATNQELQAFSYSVSHDLRAPLRHVNGFIAALRRRLEASLPDADDQVIHYLDVIERSSHKMGLLIDGLLTLSRVGRREMAMRPVPLKPLAEQAIALATDLPDGSATDIQFILDDLPTVLGDPTLLQQVFSNLIDNAVKFSRDRHPAQIHIGQTAEGAIFVRDNGVGFDMTYADKLFSPFQRLHKQEEFQGTGIGLAIVNRILHRHYGRLWADSQVGQGTTLYFQLPLA